MVANGVPEVQCMLFQATEKTRNQYRYLALRFPEYQRNLRLRSETLLNMREFLIKKKRFVEVETPTLFKKTPGVRIFIVNDDIIACAIYNAALHIIPGSSGIYCTDARRE